MRTRTVTIANGSGDDSRTMHFGLDVIGPFITVLLAIGGMWLAMSLKVDRIGTIQEKNQELLPFYIHNAISEHDEAAQYITRPEFDLHDHHGATAPQGRAK